MSLKPRASILEEWVWGWWRWSSYSESSSWNVLALVTLCQFHPGHNASIALGTGLGCSSHSVNQVAITRWGNGEDLVGTGPASQWEHGKYETQHTVCVLRTVLYI